MYMYILSFHLVFFCDQNVFGSMDNFCWIGLVSNNYSEIHV